MNFPEADLHAERTRAQQYVVCPEFCPGHRPPVAGGASLVPAQRGPRDSAMAWGTIRPPHTTAPHRTPRFPVSETFAQVDPRAAAGGAKGGGGTDRHTPCPPRGCSTDTACRPRTRTPTSRTWRTGPCVFAEYIYWPNLPRPPTPWRQIMMVGGRRWKVERTEFQSNGLSGWSWFLSFAHRHLAPQGTHPMRRHGVPGGRLNEG